MKLNRLTIENFKGIKAFSIEPGGRDVTIRGENGTGKTTIADAYAWVTTGKLSDGAAPDTQIKARGADGSTPNDGGALHAVEAEFSKDDGGVVTLRREFKEKWTKKRGTASAEFGGHTTTYYIDGTPMQKKEFERRVAELIPEEAGALLSMPLKFCSGLKWQERRKILMDMCANGMSDEEINWDIISKTKKLAPLAELLNGRSVEDLRAALKAQIKKVNEELKTIPARIDELKKLGTDSNSQPEEVIRTELQSLEKQKAEKQNELVRLENGGEVAKRQKELAETEAEMTKLAATLEADYSRKCAEAHGVIRGCESEVTRLGDEMIRLQQKITRLETIIKTTDEAAQKLREEWNAVNAMAFDEAVSDVCPYCGQTLPPEKVQEAYDKALADFNLRKSESLMEITAKGKRMMEQKARDEADIAAGKARMEELQKQVDALAAKKAETEKLLAGTKRQDLESVPEYAALKEKAARIKENIAALREPSGAEVQRIKEELGALNLDISVRQEKLAAIALRERDKKRIAELMARETELGAKYGELEGQLFMTEEFTREKVALTEDAVNSRFQFVRFKMFTERLNGALEECCEPMIDGVPFGDGLNKGNRMKAALDILNALSQYYGLTLPVFLDDCESYTAGSIIPVENQLIKLIAADGYKNLTVEVE